MYMDDIDFHSLRESKQRRLVHNRQVATTDRIVREIPAETTPVRVFEKSLDELILDTLEQGRFSINELADRFSVSDKDIRRVIHVFRQRGTSKHTGRNAKFNLITDRQGIIVAKETRETEHYYTLEKIPYFARVADPTLAFSLLDLGSRVADLPRIVEYVPEGKAIELDEEYAYVVGDYWEIDPQEVFDYITEFDREYVDTSLIPLPIVDVTSEYERVADRFRQSEGVYKRYRIDRERIKKLQNQFETQAAGGGFGIREYQATVIDLANLRWYAHQERADLLPVVDDWRDALVTTLKPEPDDGSEQSSGDRANVEHDIEIELDNQIQLTVGETPQSPREVYESFDPILRAEVTVKEVTNRLEHYARTGFIERESIKGEQRYSADFESW